MLKRQRVFVFYDNGHSSRRVQTEPSSKGKEDVLCFYCGKKRGKILSNVILKNNMKDRYSSLNWLQLEWMLLIALDFSVKKLRVGAKMILSILEMKETETEKLKRTVQIMMMILGIQVEI